MLEKNYSNDKRMVLATDLDGTFLGGSEAERQSLYQWIEDNRDGIGLIFVSGRDLPFIKQLCDGTPVPWPDFVIGDVGTTIAHVKDEDGDKQIHPIPDLEAEISELWGDAGEAVRGALTEAPGLRPQETPFRYRMSYHYDPETYDPSAEDVIREMGHDVLISDNRFFDVLPKGISKGPSLLRLIDWVGFHPSRLLVAGDTLNDLSLFETGLNGVAVGNSEAGLLKRIEGRDNVHFAKGHGAAGIREAIDAFNLYPTDGEHSNVV